MIEMRLKNGTVYQLDDNGCVISRSDGPKGWNYNGKWRIVGFKTRWNARFLIRLQDALNGENIGHGFVIDDDHGTMRMWGHPPGRRVVSLRRI